jgi:uncharacterized protein (TIGR02646 family)
MKRVSKTHPEPAALADYKARFACAPAQQTWVNFKKAKERREQVRTQLRDDQRGLCAYCENALIADDESVEHFVARDADHGRELDWTNLLLCCAGGEHPLPEEVADGATRYDPNGTKTCGHAKLQAPTTILNPLNLPHSPRLFKFLSETGEIVPDEDQCSKAGVDIGLAHETICVLGLKAKRLSDARLAIMGQLLGELDGAGSSGPFTVDRERELAAYYLPQTGFLPAFFTTIRFTLGAGAEDRLVAISFQG